MAKRKKNPFLKYENKNQKCTYPFTPDPAGYCWSYAHHVDGTKGYEKMKKICPNCDLFKPNIDKGLQPELAAMRKMNKESR